MWYVGLGQGVISLTSLACISILLYFQWWCLLSKLGFSMPTYSPHLSLLSMASLAEHISLFPHCFWPLGMLLDGKTAEVTDFHFRISFLALCLFWTVFTTIHNIARSVYLPNETCCSIIQQLERLFLVFMDTRNYWNTMRNFVPIIEKR